MATKLELQEQIIDKLIRFMLEKSVELSFNTNDINVNPNEFIDYVDPTTGQIITGVTTTESTQLIYQEDFQVNENSENNLYSKIDGIVHCFRIGNTDNYDDIGEEQITMEIAWSGTPSTGQNPGTGPQIRVYNLGANCSSLADYYIDVNEQSLSILSQAFSLGLTKTQIDPTMASEILDMSIYELMPDYVTNQSRINKLFEDINELLPPSIPTFTSEGFIDTNVETSDEYDALNNSGQNPLGSVSENPDSGFITRLNTDANTLNANQTIQSLRDTLNTYLSDLNASTTEDDFRPEYQEKSSGYLEIRNLNQSIIIRNQENNEIGIENWETEGFTITQWIKFKDKVSSGTLFKYGNPFSINTIESENSTGFLLETFVIKNDDPVLSNMQGYNNVIGSTNPNGQLFQNNDTERFVRLIVKESTSHQDNNDESTFFRDSHVGSTHYAKRPNLPNFEPGTDNSSTGVFENALGLLNNVKVPIDFNEWYFIVATYDPLNDETINNLNQNQPLYWTNNLNDPTDVTSLTYDSQKGNRCKIEIISKTDLLRARGYKV